MNARRTSDPEFSGTDAPSGQQPTAISSDELDILLGVDRSKHSLEYKGTNLPLRFSLPRQCYRATNQPDHLDLETGEVRPAMCKANICPYCVRVKRWRTARAVGASCPTAFLTFTQVGDEWPLIQRRMGKIIESLRKQGYIFEWVWKVECYDIEVERRWGFQQVHAHHVHAYVHGDSIPDDIAFGVEAERVGFGPEFHFSFLNNPEFAPRYLWGWRTKIMEFHPKNLHHHLAINGGRLSHQSRNFWRYRGERMPNMDAVLKALRERKSGSSRT